jgi:hypothetical protein
VAAARRPNPKQILERDKRSAVRAANVVGRKRMRKLLKRAETDLERRLQRARQLKGAGEAPFSTAQMKVTLAQVRAVMRELGPGMTDAVVKTGMKTAEEATKSTVRLLNAGERKYRGIVRPLPLDTATILDRVRSHTESSILHRMRSDPKIEGHRGVADRYSDNVVKQFESELQMRLVARQPWGQVRENIIKASPFLKGKPMHWAQRIVRTETMHSHNAASWQSMREANSMLGDMLKILSATFDDRTGADSYAVHGQVRRVNEDFESWFGKYMYPPNRPNDREVVVPHRMSWPIPPELEPMSDGDVESRWAEEGRKGAAPPRPEMSTVDRAKIGKVEAPPVKEEAEPPPAPPQPKMPPAPGAPRGGLV